MNINNSQDNGSLDISGYTVDISGENGTNSTKFSRQLLPTKKGPTKLTMTSVYLI